MLNSKKWAQALIALLLLSLTTTSSWAEIEDDDAEDIIEKAETQVGRLADTKSKYKDFVIYSEVAPVLKYIQKAKKLNEDGEPQQAAIYGNLAWVYGVMAMDNAKSRFFQNAADKHYLKKYEKEIKANKLKATLLSIGLQKRGASWKGRVDEKKLFTYERRRWTENVSGSGRDILKKLAGILKDYKGAKIRFEYGYRWDDRQKTKSTERADILKKYMTDQFGSSAGAIKAEGVGRKLRRDAVEVTVYGM